MPACPPHGLRNKTERSPAARGVILGLSAYFIWGFFPVYFKLLNRVQAPEVLCHRIVWSCLFLLLLCLLTGRRQHLRSAFGNSKTLGLLGTTTLLLSANWLVFIYAVSSDRILESSLGYFLNPLVSALLGRLFLQERMDRLESAAVLLAVVGVLTRIILLGRLPWIPLALAITFGLYGLLRKQASRIDAVIGLTIETSLVALPALGYLLYLNDIGRSALGTTPAITFLLILSGVITALPLIFFAAAAKRLRLTTVGFLQYLTPTLHLLIAVLLYDEPFSPGSLLSFALIWCGIALYSFATVRLLRRQALPSPSKR